MHGVESRCGDFKTVSREILKPRLQKTERSAYWVEKIESNRSRDAKINQELFFQGWTVIRFWGKDILKRTQECVQVIEEVIFDQIMDSAPLEHEEEMS